MSIHTGLVAIHEFDFNGAGNWRGQRWNSRRWFNPGPVRVRPTDHTVQRRGNLGTGNPLYWIDIKFQYMDFEYGVAYPDGGPVVGRGIVRRYWGGSNSWKTIAQVTRGASYVMYTRPVMVNINGQERALDASFQGGAPWAARATFDIQFTF